MFPAYRHLVRHVVFFVLIALYLIVISQNWSVYTSALLITLWVKQDGRLNSVPFTIGGPRGPDIGQKDAPPVTSGT